MLCFFSKGEDHHGRGQAVRAGHAATATEEGGTPSAHLLPNDQDDRSTRGTYYTHIQALFHANDFTQLPLKVKVKL